jgi:50S ribosomal subunit-associated GTPase HflX
MKDTRTKMIELMNIADQLRAEVIGASGQAQAMAMNLGISADTAENFKRLEARLDEALKDHSKKTDEIIFS